MFKILRIIEHPFLSQKSESQIMAWALKFTHLSAQAVHGHFVVSMMDPDSVCFQCVWVVIIVFIIWIPSSFLYFQNISLLTRWNHALFIFLWGINQFILTCFSWEVLNQWSISKRSRKKVKFHRGYDLVWALDPYALSAQTGLKRLSAQALVFERSIPILESSLWNSLLGFRVRIF